MGEKMEKGVAFFLVSVFLSYHICISSHPHLEGNQCARLGTSVHEPRGSPRNLLPRFRGLARTTSWSSRDVGLQRSDVGHPRC